MKIIFFGSDPWMSKPVLEALLKAKHKVMLVVTKGNSLTGFQDFRISGLKIIQAETAKDITKKELMAHLKLAYATCGTCDTCGTSEVDTIVLAAFGPPFLPDELLNWPKYGCLNVHASLLPRWRGASPVFAAINAGDNETGVSIMQMTEEIDRGPLPAQKKTKIFTDDNREILTKRLGKLGGELIVETLKKLEKDQIKFIRQPKNSPTPYTHKLTKEMGHINWNKSPAEIEKLIRAVTPWPNAHTGVKFQIPNHKPQTIELIILKAHLITDYRLPITNYKLSIDQIQLPGKNPISWKQFLAGHPQAKLF